uniref:antimicrobial peptide NK-lysin-like n=1 Tax=Scatophagus argus TaxID=75038 RepID=UPI001ED86557|nr:antimicrobial peptide NK-lysin-like [Scatophagus argus]
MKTSSVLLVCVLVTCSVWIVQGRNIKVSTDDQEVLEISVEAGKLPGICWACKWALEKVKKVIGPNTTAEAVSSKLLTICNQMGLLKAMCHKFVKTHLSILVEELTTTDDVRTICVNTGACKPKDLLDLLFNQNEDLQIEINEYR